MNRNNCTTADKVLKRSGNPDLSGEKVNNGQAQDSRLPKPCGGQVGKVFGFGVWEVLIMVLILTVCVSLPLVVQAQDIDAKLGGKTSSESFNVKDSDGNTLFKVRGDGHVGIGTTSPNEQLEITGNFRMPATTATTGSIYKDGNPFIHNFGGGNTFIGENAGNLTLAEAHSNVGIGTQALTSITSGDYNTASGNSTLSYNTTGYCNTASGYRALYSNTEGYCNTASGSNTLSSNTTGNYNTASGYGALSSNTTGNYNTASGNYVLYSNDTGNHNTASGYGALFNNTTGYYNTASGADALFSNTTGLENTASGYRALYSNTTGNYNTALGYYADVSSNNLSNTTVIGYDAEVNASNKVVIGNSNVTNIGGYADWTTYSDRRFKENIIYQDDLGLDFIMKLNTVSFNYKDDKNKRHRNGLIAQDVEAALDELGMAFSGLIVDDDEQKTMNLSYGNFILPLINAVKEQQQMIEQLKATLETLQKNMEIEAAATENFGLGRKN